MEEKMENRPILIQGAINQEIDYLKDCLECIEKETINSFDFYSGKFFGKQVIISKTKVGMVNSAAATILGINKFNPKCIINQGIARRTSKRNTYRGYYNRRKLYKHRFIYYKRI